MGGSAQWRSDVMWARDENGRKVPLRDENGKIVKVSTITTAQKLVGKTLKFKNWYPVKMLNVFHNNYVNDTNNFYSDIEIRTVRNDEKYGNMYSVMKLSMLEQSIKEGRITVK